MVTLCLCHVTSLMVLCSIFGFLLSTKDQEKFFINQFPAGCTTKHFFSVYKLNRRSCGVPFLAFNLIFSNVAYTF